MSARELETGLSTLRFARKLGRTLLENIPAENWLHVPLEDGNHAMWIAGHLAWEDDDILLNLDEGRGSKLPQSWHDSFRQGSKPSQDAKAYPSHEEVCEALDGFREELLAFFSTCEDRMAEPLPGKMHAFARDYAALMPALACHEMIHVGQLTVVRKSLKLPPVFG